jgi:hypothetical protein
MLLTNGCVSMSNVNRDVFNYKTYKKFYNQVGTRYSGKELLSEHMEEKPNTFFKAKYRDFIYVCRCDWCLGKVHKREKIWDYNLKEQVEELNDGETTSNYEMC